MSALGLAVRLILALVVLPRSPFVRASARSSIVRLVHQSAGTLIVVNRGKQHNQEKHDFRLVFLSTLALTVLAGGIQIWLAHVWLSPTPLQVSIIEGMGFTWKAGVGALLGILSVKVKR